MVVLSEEDEDVLGDLKLDDLDVYRTVR